MKDVDKKCPKKCINCEYRKVLTHYIKPYNFCKQLNVSFCGGEPKDFFNCGKGNDYLRELRGMKTATIYICEKCGKKSESRDKIIQCEASDYGLTVEEYHQWKELKRKTQQAGYQISVTKNTETEKAFDDACQALTDFEVLRGLE